MELQFRRLLNLFIILFVIVSGALVYWQVYWPTSPAPTGQDQNNYQTYLPCTGSSTPQRGNIYDRNGVLLAWSSPDPNAPCGWTRHYATAKYPSISSFLGYYSPIYGVSGIERYYNDVLSGAATPASFNDAANQYWNQILHKPIVGQNIYLTIDVKIQAQVDANFAHDFNTSQVCNSVEGTTQVGSVIVEDPHTGQILAMESRPYFNGDKIGDTTPATDNSGLTNGEEYWQKIAHDPCGPLLNRAVQGQYVPGSDFKAFTLIAALDSGQYTPSSTFTQAEATSATLGGEFFNSNNLDAYGLSVQPPSFPMDLAHAFAYSDNVVYARVGYQIGASTYLNYAHRFYMSTPGNLLAPPIDLKEALPSYVYTNAASLYPTLLAETAYGQGQLFLTPLTMEMIDSAIAADGMLYPPHLLLKTVPAGESVNSVAVYQPNGTQVFSAAVAQYVRLGMKDVVQFGSIQGSGSAWAPVYNSPSDIGGKTGTPQTSQAHPYAWFVSLAPDDAYANAGPAKLAIVVMKEQATEGSYESFIAQQIYDAVLPTLGNG
jgi:peptidoglycan glycosyltransferase